MTTIATAAMGLIIGAAAGITSMTAREKRRRRTNETVQRHPAGSGLPRLRVVNTTTPLQRAPKRGLDHDPAAVRYALDKSGLTQVQFAKEIGRSASLVSEVLAGTRNAGPFLLQTMARVLNCPIVVLEAKRSA